MGRSSSKPWRDIAPGDVSGAVVGPRVPAVPRVGIGGWVSGGAPSEDPFPEGRPGGGGAELVHVPGLLSRLSWSHLSPQQRATLRAQPRPRGGTCSRFPAPEVCGPGPPLSSALLRPPATHLRKPHHGPGPLGAAHMGFALGVCSWHPRALSVDLARQCSRQLQTPKPLSGASWLTSRLV